MKAIKTAFVGVANAGKTTLFNRLTNSRQKTGNFAGVTVGKKSAEVKGQEAEISLVDLPGMPSLYSLDNSSVDVSITQTFLKEEKPDCIVNVIDVTQLERQLYLTSQLLELSTPLVLVLSKCDRKEAPELDIAAMSRKLGCPIVKSDVSIESFLATVQKSVVSNDVSNTKLYQTNNLKNVDIATPLLAHEEKSYRNSCQSGCNIEDIQQIKQARYVSINKLVSDIIIRYRAQKSISDTIDAYLLNIKFGVPFFLLVMYLLFMFAINVGSAFIDFFDILAGTLFIDYPAHWLQATSLPQWATTLIEGVGMGVQTVLTFVPVVTCLFIGLSILESSGYLARAAFAVDALMRKMGLPGKAFVPLIVGFGCTVPAVMAARIMDSERERIKTIMMSPFMSCGARLPVYALFAAAFFPENGQNIVFALYLIGIVAAILTGFLLKATVLQGQSSHSIMELPLYELPTLNLLLSKVKNRLRAFVLGAGKTIVLVVCLLNFFNSLGVDGEFGHQDSQSSLLSQGAQMITPLLSPMGIKEDNWQAGVGIITGIFAKEALVATFNSLYSKASKEADAEPSISDAWREGIDSIGENLLGIEPVDPMGIAIGDVSSIEVAAQEQEIDESTITSMQSAFNGQLGAFSYLLFILLYTPCAAAMGAIKNETNGRWAFFAATWSFTLAYFAATLTYQLGSFANNTANNTTDTLVTLSVVFVCLFVLYIFLKRKGQRILTIPIQVK